MVSIWSIWKPDPASQATGNSTVEKLHNRVISATLVKDKSGALCALKRMLREYCKEVGELCFDILLAVIKNDESYTESVVYTVEALIFVISCEYGEERTDQLNLGKAFARVLV